MYSVLDAKPSHVLFRRILIVWLVNNHVLARRTYINTLILPQLILIEERKHISLNSYTNVWNPKTRCTQKLRRSRALSLLRLLNQVKPGKLKKGTFEDQSTNALGKQPKLGPHDGVCMVVVAAATAQRPDQP